MNLEVYLKELMSKKKDEEEIVESGQHTSKVDTPKACKILAKGMTLKDLQELADNLPLGKIDDEEFNNKNKLATKILNSLIRGK